MRVALRIINDISHITAIYNAIFFSWQVQHLLICAAQ